MQAPPSKRADSAGQLAESARSYLELTKPRITWLIVISTAVGYVFGLAAPGWWACLTQLASWRLLHTLLGTALLASGTAALNEWYERGSDRKMRRTANRPIPGGRIRASHALVFGVAISAAGFAELAVGTNWLAAFLGLLTLLLYLFVYTPLKSRSWLCTTVGALPGALPPAIGFAAAHGNISAPGLALIAILFVWQFPHFYSIAWIYRDDYARAGIQMLPVAEPDCVSTARHILFWTLILLPLSFLPLVLGLTGKFYGVAALLLGVWMIHRTFQLASDKTAFQARRVLLASVSYLPLLYCCMLLDRHW